MATFMEQHYERYKPFMCLNVDNTMNYTELVTEEDSAIEQILGDRQGKFGRDFKKTAGRSMG